MFEVAAAPMGRAMRIKEAMAGDNDVVLLLNSNVHSAPT
jgi:hypothetical protein